MTKCSLRLVSRGLVQLIILHHSSSSKKVIAGTKCGSLEAGTEVEAMEDTANWFAPLCFLITLKTTYPYQSIIDAITHSLAYRPL